MQEQLALNKFANLRVEQFDALYRISRLLNSATYQETLVRDALDLAIGVLNAERGLFANYEDGRFSIVTARNIDRKDIRDLSEFSSGILNQVISKKKPCLYHDVQSDPSVSQFTSVQIHNIKSIIGVPIFVGKKIRGVILVDSRENRQGFTEESLDFLGFFSNLVSLSLDRISRMESLQDENQILKNQLQATGVIPDMIGESPAMRKAADLIHRVAPTDANVLLFGESGTGKDLAARAIHKLSKRAQKPYLAQFCGNIPDSLLESELFGYKKGAFSGAITDKKGLFEVASDGTFFLDEIGELSPATQTKLLRVLENQEIIRVGDTQVKQVDVRIIAATNRDLKKLVSEGKFREDLFYRLNVFPITLPPLRERRVDIALLAKHFMQKYGAGQIRILPETLRKLEQCAWPGNVRQLENVLHRAIILCDGNTLKPEHVIIDEEHQMEGFSGTLKDFEKMLLLQRLQEFENNRTKAAKSLGVSVRWVQLKLKEMGHD
ncbi:MAG: GAF domain-containing protein [Calditrichaeota bacterium]|nr:GAF domain-containing protein [Calditrichota bacterium]